jgi:hypothetical protein
MPREIAQVAVNDLLGAAASGERADSITRSTSRRCTAWARP